MGKVRKMTRAKPHPHHPHLPYRVWGGGGAGEVARMTDDDLTPWWGSPRGRGLAIWTVASVHAPMYRTCRRRAALAEWLGTGLPSRSQEFDPPRPLQRRDDRRHHDPDGHVPNDRGTYQGRGGICACLSIGKGPFCPFVGQQGNGVRHVLQGVATYPGLTR